jgi:hypothetical protein
MRHWVPFDRERLERALRLRGRSLEAYLFNDHHTLAELARRRGINVNWLADHLVAPWQPIVDAQNLAVLRGRTVRVLTQGHLAQHVFRTQQAWPAQADRILARQVETLPCWLRSLVPAMDPGGPYGKATWQHGRHARGGRQRPGKYGSTSAGWNGCGESSGGPAGRESPRGAGRRLSAEQRVAPHRRQRTCPL